MEKTIHDIDVEVDKAYGTSDVNFNDSKNRTHNLVLHRLLTKYRIIYELAEQLPSDVKIMKHFIMKTISDMFSEMPTIVDIQDFKKKLKLEFSGKGNLSAYESYQIPAAKKKNLGVNGAAIKNDKKDDDKPKEVYK